MACLETDFIVELIRQKPDATAKMRQFLGSGAELSVTPITATELFAGAFASGKQADILKTEELLSTLTLLEFDLFAAKMAGEFIDGLSRKGTKIGDMDTLTAAIAIRHNQVLVTKNKKHFSRIRGLGISGW